MRAFVTGASGFIGGHVAQALLDRGYDVTALVRPGSALRLAHPRLTLAEGDVLDRSSLDRALAGCEAAFHVAARYNFWSPDADAMWRVNVDGTRNVLEAAQAAGVERIVHTGTVSTLHFPADGSPATEARAAAPHELVGAYKRTKFEAERIALGMAAAGAPIMIVNPTAPVGSGDVKPTPTGRIIVDFLRGAIPAVVDTGLNVVDVADVAEGHLLAWEKGKVGERYLLGNAQGNLTLAELLRMLAEAVGSRAAPLRKIPYRLALAAAYADHAIEGGLLRREPRIPLEGARIARKPMWADPSKAVQELGLPQSPVADALRRAAEWFADNGYLTKGKRG
ncbi:MAG: NAD-dependent epimerase/dehydratase family protein [Chloroflexota bacterium]|nr:NAD-dependent epimerase/dehydratase family protein [Chloroflexota bacterium]